jgi:spatacsin
MEKLTMKCGEGRGRALIRRIIAVIRTAKVLGLPFCEAFEKQPIELLQLLSLKAQDSFDEAKFLVEKHIMPTSSIARILADSFLKVCPLLRLSSSTPFVGGNTE